MSKESKWALLMVVLAIFNWGFFALDVHHNDIDWSSYLSLSAALVCSYAAVIWWGNRAE